MDNGRQQVTSQTLIGEIASTLLLAFVIWIVLQLMTARNVVTGSEMAPALQDGEYVLVSRLAYLSSTPQRGDIVTYQSDGNTISRMGRVIGLPGERLRIAEGVVYINDAMLVEPYAASTPLSYDEVTIPEESYFVALDARLPDSEHGIGIVQASDIIGRAWLVYWPPDRWRIVPRYGERR